MHSYLYSLLAYSLKYVKEILEHYLCIDTLTYFKFHSPTWKILDLPRHCRNVHLCLLSNFGLAFCVIGTFRYTLRKQRFQKIVSYCNKAILCNNIPSDSVIQIKR